MKMVAQADGNETQDPAQAGNETQEGASPTSVQTERPLPIVYKARVGAVTFRLSLYDRDLWIVDGRLELFEEPSPDLHNRLEAEGLERVPA